MVLDTDVISELVRPAPDDRIVSWVDQIRPGRVGGGCAVLGLGHVLRWSAKRWPFVRARTLEILSDSETVAGIRESRGEVERGDVVRGVDAVRALRPRS
jgi:predicted nucleic acid-binding protein